VYVTARTAVYNSLHSYLVLSTPVLNIETSYAPK